jgi:predicted CoA-binding protein
MNKRTIVIGASNNPDRYSFKAVSLLHQYGHEVFPLGIKKGTIGQIEIFNDKVDLTDIDTVTMYVNPTLQQEWYFYILNMQPKRIIFNPGTENNEFRQLAEAHGIECEEACTLVLLNTNQY